MNQLLLTLCATALPAAVIADQNQDDESAFFQGYIGVLELEDQTGEWDEVFDGNVEVDFGSLPVAGLEAEYAFHEGWVHWGINSGGSIAWQADDTRFAGGFTPATGGVLALQVDNSMFLAELHLGAYVRGRLHDRVTTYAAAGPMIMYGYIEVEDEQVQGMGDNPSDEPNIEDTDASDVNIGYYVRFGIDFEYRDNAHLGVGVRYLNTELDFNNTIGKLDIEGPQYMLTFSTRL
ncbi:MAG: outer membrane beta-barrel protein [Pseudomonadota bacterium]